MKGLKELKEALKEAPEQMRSTTSEVMESGVSQIVDYAKIIVPVRTGRLQRSIMYEMVDVLTALVGSNVEYAAFVEFGTRYMAPRPYLRPAISLFTPIIKENLQKKIEVILKNLLR